MSEAESKRIFQKKFNDLLIERHVTQKEIAAICGASTSTVSTWSKGLNMPRMDKIERLANHFGLPKSYFIEEAEKAPAQEGERENDDRRMKAAFLGGLADGLSDEEIDEYWDDARDYIGYKIQQKKNKSD